MTVIGLPVFATHDEVAQNFSVETDNPLDENTYTVVVNSVINVPDDYTRSSFTKKRSSIFFRIIVQEECGETIFDDLVLADMTVFVNGPANTLTFDQVQDSISKQFGNKDGVTFCGARQYDLIDSAQHLGYFSLADRTVSLESASDNDIGTHDVQLKVSLVDLPAIERIVTFKVTVDPCQVSSF